MIMPITIVTTALLIFHQGVTTPSHSVENKHGGSSGYETQEVAGDKVVAGEDHGAMDMQGGRAPADARDPHAYSGEYTLDSGDYALP